MESENIHSQHQLQEEFSFGAYSPLLATQSSYKAVSSAPSNNNLHDWNTNTMLNGSSYNTYLAESIPNSKDLWPKCSDTRDPLGRASMSTSTQNYGSSNAHDQLLLEKLKEEASISPFRAWSTSHETIHRSSSAQELEKHNLWSNSSNNFPFGHQFTGSSHPNSDAAEMYLQDTASFSRSYNFSNNIGLQRSHISTADLTSSLVSSSLSLNLEAFDFLRSANYDGSSSNSLSSNANLGYYKELAHSSGHDDHMQELRYHNSPPNNSFKRSASLNINNGAAPPVTKRPSGCLPKQKEAHGEAKKSRVVARSSCPPLKVRKEKLGDRIAALQKLVAPFGKTDTASVLTEAIGYIQFLHDQVQTLSVPYMNSTQGDEDDGRGGDLRSRGLCLVPQSCASYINDYI